MGDTPWQILITSDGTSAFVSNSKSGTVSVIDTETQLVTHTLPTGVGPFFSVINPEQNKLYVSDSRDTTVMVFDIPQLTTVKTIADVGSSPFDLAFGR